MANVFEFKKRETVTILDCEYTLAPRSKRFVSRLTELRDSFRKPGITFDELMKTYRAAIDLIIGDGSFETIFKSEEDADIDEVMELYVFLVNKCSKLPND